MNTEIRIETYAQGKADVLTVGDYPRRIGHITGAHNVWLAEAGPESLGYFKTRKAAAAAIAKAKGD